MELARGVEGGAISDSPMKAAILPVVVLLFFLVGCEVDQDTGKPHSEGGNIQREPVIHQDPARVIVTSDDASLPDACHPRQVAGVVIAYFNRFNNGEQRRLCGTF